MRLYCLSDRPNKPCYILTFKGVTLMLDCGLDILPSLNFMPLPLVHNQKLSGLHSYVAKDANDHSIEDELKEGQNRVFVDSAPEFGIPDVGMFEFSDIDVILISNYTTMLGLPYITEETGFRGAVFATEPCLQFGRLFMDETIEYIERSSHSQRRASRWKGVVKSLPPPLCDAHNPRAWRTIYSRAQMESSLNKVQLVGFSEKKDVFGLLSVSPISSGYCLGSSNWIISTGFEKIGYVSGSSTLTTHPRPMDQTPLRNLDCLILTALTQTPTHNPDPMIGEFCRTVVDTTRQGGNVLVPCYPGGITYDLFECLAQQMDLSGLSTIPMFFVSPVADSSLAYSNIMAEWLSQSKQQRVYLPEEPFPHGSLQKCGRLKSFRNLHDENFSNEYRQPCVMFCGHPSLRFGDAIHFIELWGSNSNNTIVFTEPSFSYLDCLSPFQPLHMKVIHCPIDTSLNFVQAKKLIRDLKPASLAIPEVYATPPAAVPSRTDLVIDVDIPTYKFSRYESISLPVDSKLESIQIDPSLASKLVPVEVRPGVAVATISGNLKVNNNKYSLHEISEAPTPRKRKRDIASQIPLSKRRPSQYLFGKLNVNDFVQKLTAMGILDARVEELSPGNMIIHLETEETLIQIEDNQTHIVCDEGTAKDCELLRKKIRDVLLTCLNKF